MSVNSTGVILQNDDTCNVISCQQGELGGESDDLSLNEGDFLENDPPQADQVRGRLRAHLHSWEEIGATEPVLSTIREGYKLPLLLSLFYCGTTSPLLIIVVLFPKQLLIFLPTSANHGWLTLYLYQLGTMGRNV